MLYLGTVADTRCASIVRSAMLLDTFSSRFFSDCQEASAPAVGCFGQPNDFAVHEPARPAGLC